MPLVLTTNEVRLNPAHSWDDIAGVQYHYPNQYKGKVKTGERFVYYHGVHRLGGKTGPAEYFGTGRIGSITADPRTVGQSRPSWFCTITDYVPFSPPVPAKPGGVFYEDIPKNMWRNGVRSLDPATLDRILAAAGIDPSNPDIRAPTIAVQPAGQILEADNLVIPRANVVAGAGSGSSYRKSRRAKEIGDWGELAALRFIELNVAGASNITHRAAVGETPGWDIDFVGGDGTLHRVEVKSTVGRAFATIDVTANEMRAAKSHGADYSIYLVANCLTDSPLIQRFPNPAALISAGVWSATPALFSVRMG